MLFWLLLLFCWKQEQQISYKSQAICKRTFVTGTSFSQEGNFPIHIIAIHNNSIGCFISACVSNNNNEQVQFLLFKRAVAPEICDYGLTNLADWNWEKCLKTNIRREWEDERELQTITGKLLHPTQLGAFFFDLSTKRFQVKAPLKGFYCLQWANQ